MTNPELAKINTKLSDHYDRHSRTNLTPCEVRELWRKKRSLENG